MIDLSLQKNSHGKKNIWENILEQFQSMCFDNGLKSEKSLAQLTLSLPRTYIYVLCFVTQRPTTYIYTSSNKKQY